MDNLNNANRAEDRHSEEFVSKHMTAMSGSLVLINMVRKLYSFEDGAKAVMIAAASILEATQYSNGITREELEKNLRRGKDRSKARAFA